MWAQGLKSLDAKLTFVRMSSKETENTNNTCKHKLMKVSHKNPEVYEKVRWQIQKI